MHMLPIAIEMREQIAANAEAWSQAHDSGEVPNYAIFVERLFKEMHVAPLDVILGTVQRLADDDGTLPNVEETLHELRVASTSPDASAMHAAIGCAGEGGELLDAVKKVWIYGKGWNQFDQKAGNTPIGLVIEELGDFRFYYQKLLNMLGLSDDDIKAANYAKLRVRYASGRYSDAQAQARADKPTPRQFIGSGTDTGRTPSGGLALGNTPKHGADSEGGEAA